MCVAHMEEVCVPRAAIRIHDRACRNSNHGKAALKCESLLLQIVCTLDVELFLAVLAGIEVLTTVYLEDKGHVALTPHPDAEIEWQHVLVAARSRCPLEVVCNVLCPKEVVD